MIEAPVAALRNDMLTLNDPSPLRSPARRAAMTLLLSTLTFTGTGVVSIVASQEGDGNWTAAPEEIRTITAKKGPTGLLVSAAASALGASAAGPGSDGRCLR